jgi:adenylyl- and sulfurtransferase ThiI
MKHNEIFCFKLVSNISEIFLLLHHHSAGVDEWRVCCSSHQGVDDTDAVTKTFGVKSIFIPLIAQVRRLRSI